MKQFISVILITMACGAYFSCSKNNGTPPSTIASLNIVNANLGSQGIIPNFGVAGYSYQNNGSTISYGTANNFGIIAGKSSISIVQATDTTQPFFTGAFDFKVSDIYSLFIAGTTTSLDTLFVQDNIPAYPQNDSVTGVRFVNLASGGNSITINVQGNPGQPLATAVAYKQITSFNQLPAASPITDYTFEFRDAISDSVLTTYDLFFNPLHNQTLVISGQNIANATVPLGIFEVNNY